MTQKRVLFVHSFKDFTGLFLNLSLKKILPIFFDDSAEGQYSMIETEQ